MVPRSAYALCFLVLSAGVVACSKVEVQAPACDAACSDGGDGPTCEEALRSDPGTPISIVIKNAGAESIFVDDECYADGVTGILIDDRSVLEHWPEYACTDALAGQCNNAGCDCFGDPPMEIHAGDSYTATWDGTFLEEAATPVPESCRLDSKCDTLCVDSKTCHRSVAAAHGHHTLTVLYSLADLDPLQGSIDFTLPADSVTLTIGP